MSRKDWIQAEELTAVFPETTDDLLEIGGDIDRIVASLDYALAPDWLDHLISHPDGLILFYVDNQVVGGVQLDWFKETAHLHGALLPEFQKRGIAHYMACVALDYAFLQKGKKKVFIPVPHLHDGVRGFAIRWGFRFSHNVDGAKIHVLDRKTYLTRRK